MKITIEVTETEAATLLRHMNQENTAEDRLTIEECVRSLIVTECAEIFVAENQPTDLS